MGGWVVVEDVIYQVLVVVEAVAPMLQRVSAIRPWEIQRI
jgi:hypothetical protein